MANALNLGSVKLAGDFPNIHQFNIPVVDGLVGFFLFGESPKRSIVNLAGSTAPKASMVGAPVFNGVSGAFDGANYLTLGKGVETADMSLLAIVRNTDWENTQAGFIGTNGSGLTPAGDQGVCMFEESTSPAVKNVKGTVYRTGGGSGTTAVVTADNTAFNLVSLRTAGGPNGRGYVQNITLSAATEQTATAARVANANNEFTIGRLANSTLRGKCDLVAAVAFNRSITDAELSSLTTWMRSYATSKGLTV